jgi:hypothetical protein
LPVRVTSTTSTTPRLMLTSTRLPALVAVTSYVRVVSPASTTISTRSPFMAASARRRTTIIPNKCSIANLART